MQLNSTFPPSSIEEKRLAQRHELRKYLNKNLAQLKLKRTHLLQKKKHFLDQLERWKNGLHEVELKLNGTTEQVNDFDCKLDRLIRKISECEEKIEFYKY